MPYSPERSTLTQFDAATATVPDAAAASTRKSMFGVPLVKLISMTLLVTLTVKPLGVIPPRADAISSSVSSHATGCDLDEPPAVRCHTSPSCGVPPSVSVTVVQLMSLTWLVRFPTTAVCPAGVPSMVALACGLTPFTETASEKLPVLTMSNVDPPSALYVVASISA